jgi:hypothetical protein
MAPDSIREGMSELGRMERADKWEWIIERCGKTGEPGLWQRLPAARPRTLAACMADLSERAPMSDSQLFMFRMRNLETNQKVNWPISAPN